MMTGTVPPSALHAAPAGHQRQRSACRAHCTHQVDLERSLPVVVCQVGERADRRPTDVVDEAVEPAEPFLGGGDEPLGLAGKGQVARDVQVSDSRGPASGGDDACTFGLQLPGDLEADPAGRAGHEACLPVQPEVHRGATLAA